MKNLTSPQTILCGLGLIALAIVSAPYSSMLVKPAYAASCDMSGVELALWSINQTIASK